MPIFFIRTTQIATIWSHRLDILTPVTIFVSPRTAIMQHVNGIVCTTFVYRVIDPLRVLSLYLSNDVQWVFGHAVQLNHENVDRRHKPMNVTRMKTYICICYLNVLITVLFTRCVFGCACVLLPRSHKRGMIVVKLMPNCGKINMFKPSRWILQIMRQTQRPH